MRRLIDHSGTTVTELVHRHQLRPVIQTGATVMDVDAGPLSEIDARLVRAAGLTHQATGVVIGSHTGDGLAAMAQLDLLESMGVPAEAFIWIHAQNEKDRELHVKAARRGARGWSSTA